MMRRLPGLSRLCRVMAFLVFLCLLSAVPLPSCAEESGFSLSLPREVKGYTRCEIILQSPAPGEVLLTLYDSLDNPWLYRRESLSGGENILSWDGREYSASASFSVRGYAPALALALPSSEFLYLDQGENWFVECWVPNQCIVAMDVLDPSGKKVYTKSVAMKDPDRDVIRWNGTGSDYRKVVPGKYTVHLYPKKNPDFGYTFPLTVKENTPEKPPVSVTGPVLPERGMSDAETWEIMMKPSVVINRTGSSLRFKLREEPSERSAAAGLVCCATQGLEVLAV